MTKSKSYRFSGRSTALALHAIADAMQNPNKQIPIVDHHPGREANEHLLKTTANVVEKLSLEGFYFNLKPEPTIEFRL